MKALRYGQQRCRQVRTQVLLAPEGVNGLAVFAGVLEGLAQIVKYQGLTASYAATLNLGSKEIRIRLRRRIGTSQLPTD